MRSRGWEWLALALVACSNANGTADGGSPTDAFVRGDGGSPIDAPGADAGPAVDAYVLHTDAGTAPPTVAQRAHAIATTLRGDAHFLVGMGNDLDGPPNYDPNHAGVYTLGTTLDVHYSYLTGYSDMGGWTTWNTPSGEFAGILADACQRNGGLAPMFSYYQLALEYENHNEVLHDATRMHVYLSDVRTLFTRLGTFGHPALVQFEPDFFGYMQTLLAMMHTTPDAYAAQLHFADVPECMSVPNTAAGLVPCFAAMRDALAPHVLIGMHASEWGDWWDDTMATSAEIDTHAQGVAAFMMAMGAGVTDFVTVEALDRDAGFWETNGGMAGMCSITMGSRGTVYWDETNATRPNFTDHLRWVSSLTTAMGRPALWWQIPFGVPSTTCGGAGGGSDGHWRDDRVHYFFAHQGELVAAGAFGVVYGTGADRQTDWTTDGNAFHDAVSAYFAHPTPLP
jgi:hypothetical protein